MIVFTCPDCFAVSNLKSSGRLGKDGTAQGNLTCKCGSIYRVEVVLLRQSPNPPVNLVRTVDGILEHPVVAPPTGVPEEAAV